MKIQLRTTIFLVLLSLVFSTVIASVQAAPPLPSSFYGEVKIDGANVPDGTQVSAWINGILYAQTTTITSGGVSVYVLNVPGDDPDTPNVIEGGTVGETIVFQINGQPASSNGSWQSGSNVGLNLSRTTGSPLTVSLPDDASGDIGTTVTVPLSVAEDTVGLKILSYQFTLTYDSTVLQFADKQTNGTLSAALSVSSNEQTPGVVHFAAYGSEFLTGSGVLLNLRFNVNTDSGGVTSDLALSDFMFNEGAPASQTNDGLVTANPLTISGTVTYALNNKTVDGVAVDLSGPEDTSTTTGATGAYALSVLSIGDYIAIPGKLADHQGAITAVDASYIAEYVTKSRVLSANQLAVADVTGVNGVTARDAAEIARYLASHTTELGQTGQWYFSPTQRTYSGLTTDQTGQDYSAFLYGDVNGSWGSAVASQQIGSTRVDIVSVEGRPGESVQIPVRLEYTDGDVAGFQISLTFEHEILRLVGVSYRETLPTSWNIVHNEVEDGLLVLVGYGSGALDGTRDLFDLIFEIAGVPGQDANLELTYVRINEDPPLGPTGLGSSTVTISDKHQMYLPNVNR